MKQRMYLLDYADMCKGHFCIGRKISKGSIYWEFWSSHNGGGWYSAGELFIGRKTAEAQRRKLRKIK